MLDNIKNNSVLFLDIETVPQYRQYEELPKNLKLCWDHKALLLARNEPEIAPEKLYERAGIYAEFGKIVCISVGYLNNQQLRIKSFASHDEATILNELAELLHKSYNKHDSMLCAHNGKEFDFPYIARRMLVNGIKLPAILDISGCKPWEVKHLDTMDLWKFGDHKNYTSLSLLTTIFGIQTPKDDIEGSEVYSVYWHDNDLERIVTYCQKDVIAIVQLFLRYKGESIIPEEEITIV
ncbi:MAG: 3'-5' exonuclease [Lentimicrobiaceae bacterium]